MIPPCDSGPPLPPSDHPSPDGPDDGLLYAALAVLESLEPRSRSTPSCGPQGQRLGGTRVQADACSRARRSPRRQRGLPARVSTLSVRVSSFTTVMSRTVPSGVEDRVDAFNHLEDLE